MAGKRGKSASFRAETWGPPKTVRMPGSAARADSAIRIPSRKLDVVQLRPRKAGRSTARRWSRIARSEPGRA